MRRFAWETAGWLNYDEMLLEWVALDEKAVKQALDWQLEHGMIDRATFQEGLRLLEQGATPPQLAGQNARASGTPPAGAG